MYSPLKQIAVFILTYVKGWVLCFGCATWKCESARIPMKRVDSLRTLTQRQCAVGRTPWPACYCPHEFLCNPGNASSMEIPSLLLCRAPLCFRDQPIRFIQMDRSSTLRMPGIFSARKVLVEIPKITPPQGAGRPCISLGTRTKTDYYC